MNATPYSRAAGTLLVLAAAISSATAQSLLSQYGQIVHACGQAMPTSGGWSTDFPAGATVQNTSSLGYAAPVNDLDGNLLFRLRALDNAGLNISAPNAFAWVIGRTNGDLRMLLRGSDQAPGLTPGILLRTSSATGNGLGSIRLSPSGQYLILGASLYDPVTPANTPTTADSAYFWGQPGALVPLAREGDLVPSLTGGEVYGAIDTSSNQSYLINQNGTVLIRNQMLLNTGGVTAANDAILLLGAAGGLTKFLREGDVWTGVGASGGEVLDRYSTNLQFPTGYMNLNANGSVLHDVHFLVGTGTVPVTAADDRAVTIFQGGVDTIVMREGQQAPGMAPGVLFTDVSAFSGFMSMPQSGFNKSDVAFVSTNVTGNVQVLYTASVAGGLTYVAKAGDPAPASLGAGVTYVSFNTNSMFLNDAGQIAMFATVVGGSVTAADDTVMLFGTPGNLQVIAREGAPFPLLPGAWTISSITQPAHVTERGQLAWNQSVTDGATTRSVWLSWTAENGLRIFYDPTETWNLPLGSGLPSSLISGGTIQSGDSTSVHVNAHGEFGAQLYLGNVIGSAIVRGRIGTLQATPAAINPVAGGTQTFTFDCGAARAFNIYVLLASQSGTRPGTPSPFGPQTIPLGFDAWTSLSLSLANTPVWTNSLSFLDANGKGIASFNVPPALVGWPAQLHHAIVTLDINLATTFASEPAAVKLY